VFCGVILYQRKHLNVLLISMPMALYVVQKKYRRICVVHYKLHYVTELMKLSQEIVECSLSKLEHQRTKIAIISVVVTCKNTTPKQSKVV